MQDMDMMNAMLGHDNRRAKRGFGGPLDRGGHTPYGLQKQAQAPPALGQPLQQNRQTNMGAYFARNPGFSQDSIDASMANAKFRDDYSQAKQQRMSAAQQPPAAPTSPAATERAPGVDLQGRNYSEYISPLPGPPIHPFFGKDPMSVAMQSYNYGGPGFQRMDDAQRADYLRGLNFVDPNAKSNPLYQNYLNAKPVAPATNSLTTALQGMI